MRYLKFSGLVVLMILTLTSSAFSQEKKQKKVKPISRTVDGEIITMDNDTLHGKIKIDNAEDYYITSIHFKGKKGKKKLTAYDVKWFMQVVPYPDREEYGVDHVFYKSGPHPEDDRKKVFLRTEQ